MQYAKKLISHIADRLWGKATSIELVCMRGGKLKYGLGSQMPASALAVSDMEDEMYFFVYVRVSVWLMQTEPALNGFPPLLHEAIFQ